MPKRFGALVNRFYPINIEEQKRERIEERASRPGIEVWVLEGNFPPHPVARAEEARTVEKLFLSREPVSTSGAWLQRRSRVWRRWASEIHCTPFRLSNDRTNVEDAATGAGGTRVAGLHPDTHGASQYLRNQIAVRLSVQVSRSPRTVYQRGAGEAGSFTRNRRAAEDQSRSTARRCFSGWDSRSKIIIFPHSFGGTIQRKLISYTDWTQRFPVNDLYISK